MPLNVEALRRLVEEAGPRGQAAVARRLGIGPSTLSQQLTDPRRAARATWRTVERMARHANLPFSVLWAGPLPEGARPGRSDVPRGTSQERTRRILLDTAHRLSAMATELIREANRPLDEPDPLTLEREARGLVEATAEPGGRQKKAR